MFVLKRDGRKQEVHFDKITTRITKLSYGLNPEFCDPVRCGVAIEGGAGGRERGAGPLLATQHTPTRAHTHAHTPLLRGGCAFGVPPPPLCAAARALRGRWGRLSPPPGAAVAVRSKTRAAVVAHPGAPRRPPPPPPQILVAQKVAAGVYKGVTTTELDELAAETAAALTSTHPDYATVSGVASRTRSQHTHAARTRSTRSNARSTR